MKTREEGLALLKEYNSDPFLLQHAMTVECVMRYFAREEGFEDEIDYWGLVGLMHDLDFEKYPEQHCIKTQEILRENGYEEDFIRAVASHGYSIVTGIKPERHMEKVLFAVDELTGLIGACALVRPSKSVKDMELKSLRKKFKSASFAAACSREVIQIGADMLGWELDDLLQRTLDSMKTCEDKIRQQN